MNAPSDRALTVWLVRHAQAADRALDGVDAHRPLVAKGTDQAQRLARALAAWGARPDLVLTSPWLRAAATAEALRGDAPLRHLDALAAPDAAATSAAIVAALSPTTAPSSRSATRPGCPRWPRGGCAAARGGSRSSSARPPSSPSPACPDPAA
jgi:hypothetical protein